MCGVWCVRCVCGVCAQSAYRAVLSLREGMFEETRATIPRPKPLSLLLCDSLRVSVVPERPISLRPVAAARAVMVLQQSPHRWSFVKRADAARTLHPHRGVGRVAGPQMREAPTPEPIERGADETALRSPAQDNNLSPAFNAPGEPRTKGELETVVCKGVGWGKGVVGGECG